MTATRSPDDGGGQEDLRTEQRLGAAAALVRAGEPTPGPVPLPDFPALLAGRARRRRAGMALGAAAALAGAAAIAVWLRGDPVSYAVVGAAGGGAAGTMQAGAIIEGPAPGAGAGEADVAALAPTRLLFSEGTEVGIDPGAALRVLGRTARGADLSVERGRASFNVARRPDARWAVRAGPFTVAVTGTRFSVDWSPRDQHLVLDLQAGGVVVRGGAAEESGVAVRPGERLEAFAHTGQLTVRPSAAPPPPPPPTAANGGPEEAAGGQATGAPVKKVVIGPHVRRVAGAARPPIAAAKTNPEAPEETGAADRTGAPLPSLLPDLGPAPAPDRPALDVDPARPRAPLPPAPPAAALPPSNPALGGGGVWCGGGAAAQHGFEQPDPAVSVTPYYMLSFSAPRAVRTHSFCGRGSLRVDATFNETGRKNFFGRLPYQTGQVVVRLPQPVDFTGKTLTIHFFVEGPSDVRLSALPVVIHRGIMVPGQMMENVVPDRWLTVSYRFDKDNPLPDGKTSPVTDCNRVALILYNSGGRRTWNGAVYIDDLGWK